MQTKCLTYFDLWVSQRSSTKIPKTKPKRKYNIWCNKGVWFPHGSNRTWKMCWLLYSTGWMPHSWKWTLTRQNIYIYTLAAGHNIPNLSILSMSVIGRLKYQTVWNTFFNKTLTFKGHFNKKCQAVMVNFVKSRKISQFLYQETYPTLVLGLVMPHLVYTNALLSAILQKPPPSHSSKFTICAASQYLKDEHMKAHKKHWEIYIGFPFKSG